MTVHNASQLPPRAEEISQLIKERLADVRTSGGTRETVTLEWGSQPLHVEVIDLPLTDVYYNPDTHRVRAQRGHKPELDAELEAEPYGEAGQRYLGELLQALPSDPGKLDPAFENLKRDLEEFGQNDPGLVTHHGVLVNGNTRAAALRALKATTIRVGVLPASFTSRDVSAVELALQLRKDNKRDYSYINRLLAMEEQAGMGHSPAQIAREFRIQEKTYHQERWILSTIRELIDRSATAEGASLRLVDFEFDQEKLKELERLYKKISSAEPDEAELIKELRLAGILLDFSKTDVRHIDQNFVKQQYLAKTLPPVLRDLAGDSAPAEVAIPGLGVSVSTASSRVAEARALNDRIIQSLAARKSTVRVSEERKTEVEAVLTGARAAFDAAIDRAGRDARIRKRKQLAPARLAEASAFIDQTTDELVKARTSHSLDEEAFDEALVHLRKSLTKLARQAGRVPGEPGDGVAWLLSAVTAEGGRP
ncbi:hypothetical protein GA0115251_107316 [Streptomyces sp. TverLS-915]|nr:hypothetical protein GA0115251_107316 [Streptomyces sp. TverLS-915]